MNSGSFFSPARTVILSLSIALAFAGCNSKSPGATDDVNLDMQVQARLFADQNLSGQTITATVANGVVTLNGSVSSDTARSIASGDAAQIAGVRTVVNNLVVQNTSTPLPSASAAATPPPTPKSAAKPSAAIAKAAPLPMPAPVIRNLPSAQQPQPPQPQPQAQAQLPPPPPPPPAAVVHNITLPAGTDIPVRITQTLDSATTQPGDKFTGTLASDLVTDGIVVLAQGTPVTGNVDAVQDAAHFKGSSLLTISLSAIDRHGERIQVATDAFTKQGEGRGKNTAEKVGGGAAVGAILGGIFGGGKGAAIGSVAGGGLGAGANGVTRGQQVQIPSETVVRFRLSNAIIVHVTNRENSPGSASPGLERHNDQ